MNLLKPFSASPSVSFNASSLIFNKYSPLFTAVATSFAVYAIGRPICSVSSFANTSCLSLRSLRALLTIACLPAKVDLRKLRNASVATWGRNASSVAEMPFLVTTGLFVVGDTVVIISTDILATFVRILCRKKEEEEEEDCNAEWEVWWRREGGLEVPHHGGFPNQRNSSDSSAIAAHILKELHFLSCFKNHLIEPKSEDAKSMPILYLYIFIQEFKIKYVVVKLLIYQ
jgi:hypothetical protein